VTKDEAIEGIRKAAMNLRMARRILDNERDKFIKFSLFKIGDSVKYIDTANFGSGIYTVRSIRVLGTEKPKIYCEVESQFAYFEIPEHLITHA
jgi:hypothetical protein